MAYEAPARIRMDDGEYIRADIVGALIAALAPFAEFRTAAKPGKLTDRIKDHFSATDFWRLRDAIDQVKDPRS